MAASLNGADALVFTATIGERNAAIRRDDRVIIPTGTDQVQPGDKVMVVTFIHNEEQVRAVIRGEYR